MSNIHTGRDLILEERIFHRVSLGIIGNVLGQGHADALQDTSLGLYPGQVGVDGRAAVHTGVKFQNLDFAGLFVQLDFRSTHHVRRRRQRRGMGFGNFQRDHVAELGSARDLRQRNAALRCSVHIDFPAVKGHFIRGTFQHLSAQLADLLPELEGAFFHSLAGDIRCTGGIGTGIIR